MTKQLARNLRKRSSEAEKLLWFHLRDRRLQGFKFRRQYSIGLFIVDFVCLEGKLIVEVDGGQHAETLDEDQRRTEFLQQQGYIVLRFWNNEVLKETDSVLQVIVSHLSEN